MKVIILGSTGILGRTLSYFLLDKKNIELKCISRNKKDKFHIYFNNFLIFDKLEKFLLEINPTHIINCLGVTKFNNKYKSIKNTSILNTKFPIFLSKFCLKNKIKMIHISTDCVFSGKKGNYKETSKKDAKDLYGITKKRGEVKNEFVTTIRTSFIGPEKYTKKSLLNWVLSQKGEVNGFTNAFFSGLTSLELSKIIYFYFLKQNLFYNKILNVSGQKISKYLLLKKISKIFNKKISIKKSPKFRIDRSLNSENFSNLTNYKKKTWNKMITDLKFFMITNKYKY